MLSYFADKNYTATENTIVATYSFEKLADENLLKKHLLRDSWINPCGWQSWNPCEEIASKAKQKSLTCHLIHQWNQYLVFPESKFKPSKNIILGQFYIYFRWENNYLFLVSTGNIQNSLPPVQFVVNKKENTVLVELADKGKTWNKDELQCQIEIFSANSYFDARDKLTKIFGTSDTKSSFYSNRFDSIQFLGKTSLGWESWYNHYANINQELILNDLNNLVSSENFLSLQQTEVPKVFQIDDGWEKALGDWQLNKERFSDSFKQITQEIENKNLVPGLWIAPFIIDERSETAKQHPDWLLKNKNGKLVPAGFNPLWGKNGTFYPLDLSNEEVLNHLEKVIETAIEEWGFRYLKLDFLYAGMLYGNFKNSGGAYEWYNKAIKRITSKKTNSKGMPVTYLGCGVPFEPSFNYLPLSRIGCDTYEHWENKLSKKLNWNGRNSACLNLKDTLGHAITDKIIFANDPDVIFIRENNCSLTTEEKLLIGKINILFGSQLMYSDDPSANLAENSEEKQITEELIKFKNEMQTEEFQICNLKPDYYEIKSRSGNYKGFIDLGKKHTFELYKIQDN